MIPVLIPPLPTHYRDDTWKGLLGFGPVLIDGAQPPNSLTSCRMQFRDDRDVLGYELNSVSGAGIGTLTIADADTWEVTIPSQLLPLDTGAWLWDFETTDSAGTIMTLYKGTIRVDKDITHG